MERWPLGVFASIDAGLGVKLEVVHELGIPTIQLHAPAPETRTAENAQAFLARLKELGIKISVVFCGFHGESYESIQICRETVGLVPPATREARTAEMKEIADFAKLLGVGAVGIHIGFLPPDTSDPTFGEIVAITQGVCDYLDGNGQRLHLETGQEAAEELMAFIEAVDRPNLAINFDPANMILYGSGDPIEALERVGDYVASVHCKDAKWSENPGVDWGAEVPLGEGAVGMEKFLETLLDIGYEGPLTIEREIPQDPQRQKAEIGAGAELLQTIKKKIGVIE